MGLLCLEMVWTQWVNWPTVYRAKRNTVLVAMAAIDKNVNFYLQLFGLLLNRLEQAIQVT